MCVLASRRAGECRGVLCGQRQYAGWLASLVLLAHDKMGGPQEGGERGLGQGFASCRVLSCVRVSAVVALLDLAAGGGDGAGGACLWGTGCVHVSVSPFAGLWQKEGLCVVMALRVLCLLSLLAPSVCLQSSIAHASRAAQPFALVSGATAPQEMCLVADSGAH